MCADQRVRAPRRLHALAGAAPDSQPREELLAKLRAFSPPTTLAALRVSSTPSDVRTPSGDAPLHEPPGGAWWRAGHGSGGSSSGRSSGERRNGSGNEPCAQSAADPSSAEAPAEDPYEASRSLALLLQQEEHAAFLQSYAQNLLTSPDNPTRRTAQGAAPGSHAVTDGMEAGKRAPARLCLGQRAVPCAALMRRAPVTLAPLGACRRVAAACMAAAGRGAAVLGFEVSVRI